MLKRGFLTTTAFYPSFAHKETHLLNYEVAVNEVFQLIKDAIKKNIVGSTIKGPTCHSGFKRLTWLSEVWKNRKLDFGRRRRSHSSGCKISC